MSHLEIRSFFSNILLVLALPGLALWVFLGMGSAALPKRSGPEQILSQSLPSPEGTVELRGQTYAFRNRVADGVLKFSLGIREGSPILDQSFHARELLPREEGELELLSLQPRRFVPGPDLLLLDLYWQEGGQSRAPVCVWLTPEGELRTWPGEFFDFQAESGRLLCSRGVWQSGKFSPYFTRGEFFAGRFLPNGLLILFGKEAGAREVRIRRESGEELHSFFAGNLLPEQLWLPGGENPFLFLPDPVNELLFVLNTASPEHLNRYPLGGLGTRSRSLPGQTLIPFGKERELLVNFRGEPVAWIASGPAPGDDY